MTDTAVKVLLVEDNLADARLLKESLADATGNRFEVTHCVRLELAVKELQQAHFDILLLDLTLPDSQGLETVERMHVTDPHLPIVVLTGLDDEAMALEAVRKGAQDYLVKGQSDSRLLVRAMRYAIERKRVEEEQHQLQQQMQQMQKLESVGLLAGGIAHDFNNLLVGILGNAGLAQMELSPVSPVLPYMQQIQIAARRAAALCQQLLAYAGKGRFVIETVNLTEVVKEMAQLLEVSISKKIALRFNLMSRPPLVKADPTQIRQIVMNLITNASEAIGEQSGVITLSTGLIDCDSHYLQSVQLSTDMNEGKYVYVEVSDTGHGMDAETIAKIFDPFFTTKFLGRGLGLAAVQGIIRGHKGAIKVYSEPGRGTTFRVFFPALEQSSAMPTPTVSFRTPCDDGTVLVVDDEEIVRHVVRQTLESAGFKVLLACDGAEGVQVYQEHIEDIHLVLLDLTMPQLDGLEAFRRIRQLREDVPVVLMSGYTEQDATARFNGKGLAGFIQKPFEAADLLARIRGVCGAP